MAETRADIRPPLAGFVRKTAQSASAGVQTLLGRLWFTPLLRRRPWRAFVAISFLLTLAAVWAAGDLAKSQADREIRHGADVAAQMHAAVLHSELERHRSLPFVLAEDADLHALLTRPNPARADAINRKLAGLSARTRAAVIYLLDQRGVAIASSNWNAPDSFVGTDYAFRPYFTNALRDGVAEYFALGAVSRRPGLFLSRRISAADGALLGVVVVKVEFDALEAEWRRSGEPAYVADANGVVLVTNIPQWRFGLIEAVSAAERRDLGRSLQMPEAQLQPLPFQTSADNYLITRLPGASETRTYVEASAPTDVPGWTLHLLAPVDPLMRSSVVAARTLAFLATCLCIFLAGLVLYRHDRNTARALAQQAARQELERRVEERTRELRGANERLVVEMDERRRAEADLHVLRDELVQANKLAVLGQIAAGVAHEINQPVAAIRTYADNTGIFLDREQPQKARENLSLITAMTQRIGVITDELRAFARKTTGVAQPITLEEPIAGALLLIGPRARQRGVKIIRAGSTRALRVMADRTRLEQVLVNLLQNAIEALKGTAAPLIKVQVLREDDRVLITVADNGPGVAPEVRERLFTPFVTNKEDGLGLGLIISRDIVAAFGGELTLKPSEDPEVGGAVFSIRLRRAS